MSRFGKGNHDIYERVNRKYKHGESQTSMARLPHRARRSKVGGMVAPKLGRKRPKVLTGA